MNFKNVICTKSCIVLYSLLVISIDLNDKKGVIVYVINKVGSLSFCFCGCKFCRRSDGDDNNTKEKGIHVMLYVSCSEVSFSIFVLFGCGRMSDEY